MYGFIYKISANLIFPEVESLNSYLDPINSATPKDVQFTIIFDKEKQLIITFKKPKERMVEKKKKLIYQNIFLSTTNQLTD